MEPAKFEEYSREHFEERKIQPSAQAWSKLDKMLDGTSASKKKNNFNWFAIAAMFIGFLIIGSLVFNNTGIQETRSLVEEETPSEPLDIISTKSKQKLDDQTVVAQTNRIVVESDAGGNKTAISSAEKTRGANDAISLIEKNTTASISSSNNENSLQKNRVQTTVNKVKKPTVFHQSKEALAIQEFSISTKNEIENKTMLKEGMQTVVIAENKTLSLNQNIFINDVNALLIAAQKDILTQEKVSTKNVDAMKLLGDVELEMKQTLRKMLFYALGQGVDYVKTSIVDRSKQ